MPTYDPMNGQPTDDDTRAMTDGEPDMDPITKASMEAKKSPMVGNDGEDDMDAPGLPKTADSLRLLGAGKAYGSK